MTTMELNLRKEYLYDLIKGMDEERLSKVETYIKRLCLAKQKESLYPWAPDEAELTCKIAESEVDFNNGDYCTQKALKKKLQKKLASWYKKSNGLNMQKNHLLKYQIFDTRQSPDKLMDLFR